MCKLLQRVCMATEAMHGRSIAMCCGYPGPSTESPQQRTLCANAASGRPQHEHGRSHCDSGLPFGVHGKRLRFAPVASRRAQLVALEHLAQRPQRRRRGRHGWRALRCSGTEPHLQGPSCTVKLQDHFSAPRRKDPKLTLAANKASPEKQRSWVCGMHAK